ncbi:ABC transporter substrate-binding protein [Pseudovibrio ascidiaceicola]|jgi:sn-glycerol 3-phosphate transport system substrate-binding protein|uniref:Carbohydrate ABC transporter substrate-binding protein, CUT1 family (TC 3.A.1.1.-) n=1 Tax=Pseudovibrio ascidiaceicola TaxID=285279 RepID=A0A1I3VKR6_9HYPH|nr:MULTISPECIES: ABC transporter substrate-binding protein [Pseudovibrio]KZK87219.1 sn-glycerol-3-phosphate-binding periplasmic protein UgpB precursor [Pseudovibrio sp. Ad13]KZL16390.1 sn-glycerol-3-phosphate-binding periplasmic protein UgpB precursor [Pseudovibrio sp. Ad26]SFJ95855.1 carbohydrate ABC transporter substrate-binding protein, CUT1 family (TC 3.A.1.1.-) [Pseudovibrio ascidiaceicola]
MKSIFKSLGLAASAAALSLGTAISAHAVDLQFYFPVAVGGTAATTIEELTAEYAAAHPDVNINAVYAGSYQDTVSKALTAARGGNPPQLSVILSVDMFTLIDEDVIIAFDDVANSDEDKKWLNSFYPAFMENSQTGGKTYGIPFQRSTPVLYWNKEAFKAAGLDPEKAPATWEEMVSMGQKLIKKDASGNVTQWGVRIPSSGFPYWLFQGLTTENDAILANADGNKTNFDDPKVVEALQYLVDLSGKHGVMAPGIIEWGATPKAFFEGNTAMMWTSTGNLTNVRNNAPFDFGVAMLPANKRRGAPTGGGNFYIFKDSSDEQKKASVDFVKWITAPKQAAKWSMATGYVAPSPAAWETDEMKAYAADFPPALVAREQLNHAVAELSTYQNQRVTRIFNDALHAAITGKKTPEEALKSAQAEADRILSEYR